MPTGEELLAWTGGQILGGWDEGGVPSSVYEAAARQGLLDRTTQFLMGLETLPGTDLIQSQGHLVSLSELREFLDTPDGQQWLEGLTEDDLTPFVSAYLPGGGTVKDYYKLNLGDFANWYQVKRGYKYGGPFSEGRPYYPAGRYGTAPAATTPAFSYYPEWYKFREAQLPESRPRRTFAESIFPELTRRYETSLLKQKGEGYTAAEPKVSTWREFLRKYPFEAEWGKLSPEERGYRFGYQPRMIQYGY